MIETFQNKQKRLQTCGSQIKRQSAEEWESQYLHHNKKITFLNVLNTYETCTHTLTVTVRRSDVLIFVLIYICM